jgi:large subunit ribosomal protein L10
MNRQEKVEEIESLKTRFSQSQLTIVAGYKGLNVASVTELRRKLHEKTGSFKVIKNRLAKIAAKGTSVEVLSPHFKDAAAVVTTGKDMTAAAKVLTDFAKGNDKLEIKIGLLDGKVINLKDIKALADMPSKEELIAKMLGSFKAPATNLVNVLIQIPRQLVQVLAAVKDQKEKNA